MYEMTLHDIHNHVNVLLNVLKIRCGPSDGRRQVVGPHCRHDVELDALFGLLRNIHIENEMTAEEVGRPLRLF